MTELEKALETLKNYIAEISRAAGFSEEYGEALWSRIEKSNVVLRELAYFHDYNNFLGEYRVAGFTLMDIVVWQVDHFKAYMDRDEMNRYHRERLLLESLDTMLKMEEDPEPYIKKMKSESGNETRTINE